MYVFFYFLQLFLRFRYFKKIVTVEVSDSYACDLHKKERTLLFSSCPETKS